jgi:hypothetical protein
MLRHGAFTPCLRTFRAPYDGMLSLNGLLRRWFHFSQNGAFRLTALRVIYEQGMCQWTPHAPMRASGGLAQSRFEQNDKELKR